MEFLSHFPKHLGIIVLLALLYKLIRIRLTRKKAKTKQAPEPSGAWPFIGHLHLLGGRTPVARILGAMSDKYGSIYSLRLGNRRALVVSSWEMVKECFTINDKNFATRPHLAVAKYIGYKGAVFATAPYGPYWRDVRKMVTLELFTAQRLEKMKHVRASEMDFFIKDLYLLCGSWNGNVMMTKLFEHLTFNITTRMLAGKRFSISTDGHQGSSTEDWRAKESIHKALYLSGVFIVSDVIPSLEWIDIGGYLKSMERTAKELDLILEKWLEEHKLKKLASDDDGEADFMDVMLSTLPEDTIMSGFHRDTIVKATTLILILTGTESTAETLTWALSLLLNNRDVLETVQDELDLHVGRYKWTDESDIAKLPYLQAIVKETLRMYPPGPLAGPHEAIEDCKVGGYHVAKGTRLIVNLWKLHRDPRVWSEPDEFRPKRFLEEHSGIKYLGQNFEYIPFSSGRRMCPAGTFALQVVHLALARLLQGFDLSTPSGEPVDMCEGLGIALPKVEPLEVRLTPRLPLELYQNL